MALRNLPRAARSSARELAHVLADLREDALPAEHFDTDGFEFFARLRGANAGERVIEKILHLFLYDRGASRRRGDRPAVRCPVRSRGG